MVLLIAIIYFSPYSTWRVTDNKSLNNTNSHIKPKVWVETGQMHQKSETSAVDYNENAVHNEHNEVCGFSVFT
jgi:hypothetical protein